MDFGDLNCREAFSLWTSGSVSNIYSFLIPIKISLFAIRKKLKLDHRGK